MHRLRVSEIFHSLQGEGRHTGTSALFVRLAGCNLQCPWCDTDHTSHALMSATDIAERVHEICGAALPPIAVITGGEPTLQLHDTSLPDALHALGMKVHLETNGTIDLADDVLASIDWVTCSPKADAPVRIRRIDELKVVFDGIHDPEKYMSIPVTNPECRYLQPCDTGHATSTARNTAATIEYIRQHPWWHLSLQTHKLLNIP